MWSGEKLKPPTKDTHTLRLNLKSPENRQRYPPDEDLDAIHVISSEYEVAIPGPNIEISDQLANYTQIYNTTHDPRFLPKLKYGAVSKSYLKKLSSIFTQHPPSKQIFLDPSQVKLPGDGQDGISNPIDIDDEGNCSLSDKSSIRNYDGDDDVDDVRDNVNLCDKKGSSVVVTVASINVSANTVPAATSNKSVNDNGNSNRNSDKSVDGAVGTGDNRGLSQFSLPRIALNKQQG